MFLYRKFLLLLSGVMMTLNTHADASKLYIRSLFDIQYAYCEIKTNGVVGMDNKESVLEGRGFGTASTAAMMMMENGDNEISLEMGAPGWFSDKKLSEKERAQFNPQAGCKLELTAMRGSDNQILSAITVGIGKDGLPEAKPQADEKRYAAISSPIKREVVAGEQAVAGHIDSNYFDARYFPPGMQLYRFSRHVQISGMPEWAWTKATIYKDTTEQRQQLQQAYEKVWQAFNARDIATIRRQQKIALQAWAWATNETEDSVFLDREIKDGLDNNKFRMVSIDWEDYKVITINKGRMVRFVNKSAPDYSPISYYINVDDEDYLTGVFPIFSLINGEFVQVI